MPGTKAVLWGIAFGLAAIWLANTVPVVGGLVGRK